MSRRTQGAPASSLRSARAGHVIRVPLPAAPPSNQESLMYAISEQIARSHIHEQHRQAEAWRIRSIARAARRAQQAERRAQEAREDASYASHRHSVAIAR